MAAYIRSTREPSGRSILAALSAVGVGSALPAIAVADTGSSALLELIETPGDSRRARRRPRLARSGRGRLEPPLAD